MSVLMAVVSSVAPLVSASPSPMHTPVPSPEIINHVQTVTVYALTPLETKALQLLLLFLSGVGASMLHAGLEATLAKSEDGFSRGLNLAIQGLLGVAVATVATVLQLGHVPTWNDGVDLATTFLIVLGSSQGRYQFKKWTDSLGTDSPEPDPTTSPGSGEQEVPQKAGV